MIELNKKVPPHKALVGWVATCNYHVLLVEGKIDIKDMPLLFFTFLGGNLLISGGWVVVVVVKAALLFSFGPNWNLLVHI